MLARPLQDQVQPGESIGEPESGIDLGNAARAQLGERPRGVVAAVNGGGRGQCGEQGKLVAAATD